MTKEYEKEFLTADDAAELLEVTPKLIRDMARDKKIPGRKVGREWRFSRTALIEWMKGTDE